VRDCRELVVSNPGVMMGKPVIAGTRIAGQERLPGYHIQYWDGHSGFPAQHLCEKQETDLSPKERRVLKS
jgi:hypothetical protein